MSRTRAQEAGNLLRAARDSLSTGSFESALEVSQRIIRDYPGAPGSGEALGIAAEALMALGRPAGAAEAASRIISLLPATHPALPRMSTLAAGAYWEIGEEAQALAALRGFPSGSTEETRLQADSIMRGLLPGMDRQDLEEAVEEFPTGNPLWGILATELASTLYQAGESLEATIWAEEALSLPLLGDREREIAQGVVEGRLEEVLGHPYILGAILPRSEGSPGLLQFGEWVYEGIQVALEEYKDRVRRPVLLEVLDDEGNPLGGRAAVETLEELGALAAVGPITQDVLEEAADARAGTFPILSPFSYLPPEEATDVFSLSGPDPGGARLVAHTAWDLGLASVAVVRPETQEARVNAQAFREEYEALGGFVPREIVFDSGGTFFHPQFLEVEAILPDGLFLPLTPQDIQLLAPQVTFYGLDTLGIQLLGTSGWAEEAVVRDVDSRHTDGVIAATIRLTQEETDAYRRFREAYESFFQKTLRSQAPAFGYDAASLLLSALESGPRNSRELVAALEEIRDLPGATGSLSVDRGWVIREPLLIRIQDHELIYITRRYD
jgi:ABC-type branched-subunit amino acid transport system substrate-binding protein